MVPNLPTVPYLSIAIAFSALLVPNLPTVPYLSIATYLHRVPYLYMAILLWLWHSCLGAFFYKYRTMESRAPWAMDMAWYICLDFNNFEATELSSIIVY